MNIDITPPFMFSTSYIDHDKGGKYAGPPVIARSLAEAEVTVKAHIDAMLLHPSLRIDAQLPPSGGVADSRQ